MMPSQAFEYRKFANEALPGILLNVLIGFCVDFRHAPGLPGQGVAKFFKIAFFMDQFEGARKGPRAKG